MSSSNSRYFAVALVPDQNFSTWAEGERKGLAKRFPVHLTVHLRFSPPPFVSEQLLVTAFEKCFAINPIKAELRGPKFIGGRIKWLECMASSAGYSAIINLHTECLETNWDLSVRPRGETAEFEGRGYRPHVTIDWNEQGLTRYNTSMIQESVLAKVEFSSWALYRYPDDSRRRGVETVYAAQFNQE